MALIYNATFDSQTRILSLLDKAGNVISSCEVPSKDVDDITKPLTFKAIQDGSSVKLVKYGSPSDAFQTSRDGGDTWTYYTIGTSITLNTGDEVSFRTMSNRVSPGFKDYYSFRMEGKIEAWHNVMSMLRVDDFATHKSVGQYALIFLFSNCDSLTKAPALPATELGYNCYWSMFANCGSLTKAPALPATTLADSCFFTMFRNCESLKEVRISATKTATSALYNWLEGVSATGDFYCDPNATIFPTDSASGIPKGWNRIPAVDDITKPLTFRAKQDGSTVKLIKRGSPSGDFQTSRDGGNTWTDYTIDTAIALNTGDEVSFRAKADRTSAQSYDSYFYFTMTGKIEAWHNVMSLYRTNDFATYGSVMNYAFGRMFENCASLIKAPVLPATTLAVNCYELMFYRTSLIKAPALPATTLVNGCYSSMFMSCESLIKPPELTATTLKSGCYYRMFFNCRSLKEVRISATTTAESALDNWLANVSATGDFYCDPNATIFPTDNKSGIPANWNRHALADYPN